MTPCDWLCRSVEEIGGEEVTTYEDMNCHRSTNPFVELPCSSETIFTPGRMVVLAEVIECLWGGVGLVGI